MPAPQIPEPFVTTDELAQIMGISRSTIKRMVKEGMPVERWGVRVIRFRPSQCIEWARNRPPRV